MQDQNARRAAASSGCMGAVAAVTILMFPLFYFLSVGPAVWLRDHGLVSNEALMIVYFPFVWLEQKSELCRNVIEWYAELWM